MADIKFVTKDNLSTIVSALVAALSNQNAFSTFTVDQTDIDANAISDAIELVAGTNVTITADANAGTITFAATDTTYSNATPDTYSNGAKTADGTAGLMSGADKYKLNGIEDGAEVNQSAFANFVVGATTVAADSKQDSLTIAAGTNVTITADADTDTITITAADTTYTLEQDATDGHKIVFTPSVGDAVEITIPDDDTTYDAAVPSVAGVGGTDGLLEATDKEKLDGVAAGAQANVLESVKVNGTALTPTSKAVDITVTAGDSGVGTLKVNGSTVTPYGLGTAAGATVETTGVASDTTTVPTTAQVKSYVDTVVANNIAITYKPAGNISASGLTSSLLVAANLGKVYSLTDTLNITSANEALFKDGEDGESFPEGSDVSIILDGNDYLFNIMPGFVDLSSYAQTADFGGLDEDDIEDILGLL